MKNHISYFNGSLSAKFHKTSNETQRAGYKKLLTPRFQYFKLLQRKLQILQSDERLLFT